MPEERKLVTIMFADIVASSAVGAAEDPELVRRTLARTFAQMRESLTAHGGTVEQFIGDAVMSVFGIPQAHDDDADRALRAAFDLRERITTLSTSLPFPVHLRIGILPRVKPLRAKRLVRRLLVRRLLVRRLLVRRLRVQQQLRWSYPFVRGWRRQNQLSASFGLRRQPRAAAALRPSRSFSWSSRSFSRS